VLYVLNVLCMEGWAVLVFPSQITFTPSYA
jgi:hypothetical protein